MVLPPINFPRWVEENQERLAPPVGNFCLFRSEDYTIMVVGGPNQRSDYHFQPTEEFFYQVKGGMILKIIEEGKFKDVPIEEGEMFMLPANTPHSPQRFENTVGLVVERTRPDGHDDELRWYCPNTEAHSEPTLIRKASFHCVDLGTQLKPHIIQWNEDASVRTCAGCGYNAGPRDLISPAETVNGKQP